MFSPSALSLSQNFLLHFEHIVQMKIGGHKDEWMNQTSNDEIELLPDEDGEI